MKLALFGKGKMGSRIAQLAPSHGHEIVSSVEECDCVIDFSHASVIKEHVLRAAFASKPIIIGTTGWEEDLLAVQHIVSEAEIGALFAPNFSIGVALFIEVLKRAQELFPEYAISGEEVHNKKKKHAPSGTAKKISATFEMDTPFTSTREGRVCGSHTLHFDSPTERISITHQAKSRDGFALGALEAAEWIQHKKGWYTLDALYRSYHTV